MVELLLQPFLLGLSVGLFCLSTCLPFVAPCLIAEKQRLHESFLLVFKFIGGRFFGYMLFGAVFAYLGEKLDSHLFQIIAAICLILLSIFLMFYMIGVLRGEKSKCGTSFLKTQSPFWMGFLMGINVCPPFLMSFVYVFTLKSVLKGMAYFFIFFLTTTIYVLPFGFLGALSKMKEFQIVARISGFLVTIIFITYGLYLIRINL